ncbi:MAG: hypothetical protein GY820_44570 [Gammaproteobacteria bacterium]|nr:hypothetical protein [Gammaproteobacteria bacterium]
MKGAFLIKVRNAAVKPAQVNSWNGSNVSYSKLASLLPGLPCYINTNPNQCIRKTGMATNKDTAPVLNGIYEIKVGSKQSQKKQPTKNRKINH